MSGHIFVNLVRLDDAYDAGKIPKDLMPDVKAIIEYMWDDEKRHYSETVEDRNDIEDLVEHARKQVQG